MPKIKLRTTCRLDLLYVLPGETNSAPGTSLNRELSDIGRGQIVRAAGAIRRSGRPRPQAVMLPRNVMFTSLHQTAGLLAETLRLPAWPDGNLGEGATAQDLADYRTLPASALVIPITPTGMSKLLRRLSPTHVDADWPTRTLGSVWRVRVECSLNGPPVERSIQLVSRISLPAPMQVPQGPKEQQVPKLAAFGPPSRFSVGPEIKRF